MINDLNVKFDQRNILFDQLHKQMIIYLWDFQMSSPFIDIRKTLSEDLMQ